jgi:hypothetical protein
MQRTKLLNEKAVRKIFVKLTTAKQKSKLSLFVAFVFPVLIVRVL